MSELHLPWLEMMVLLPLMGAIVVSQLSDSHRARKWCLVFTTLTFLCAAGAWQDFHYLRTSDQRVIAVIDHWHLMSRVLGHEFFVLDQLSAPLLPLVALLNLLTVLSTQRTKVRRFSFALTLVSEAIILATFCCRDPWGVIILLAIGTLPPLLELRARGQNTRVYAIHMAAFVALMVIGWIFVERGESGTQTDKLLALLPLLGAVWIRSGIAPFHCWITDLFERATFGTALLFVTPIVGAYAAVRLVLPISPDWVLRSMGTLSLLTALYASGMAIIQTDARRFFCYLFLSHSALVLVGLEMVTPISLTGALCVWLSAGLSLGGFGLTLRALESRVGRLSLTEFRGLYSHAPDLAIMFVLTGLGSVGFPGTLGFIGTEMLVDGAVTANATIGFAVVVAAALNGIAIMHAYFLLFTGKHIDPSVSLQINWRERLAVLALAGLILIGGLIPQPNIVSRYSAAVELLQKRPGTASETPAHAFLLDAIPAPDAKVSSD